MKWTNNCNLPLPLVSAIQGYFHGYSKAGRISVTGLILPPRIRVLQDRHDAEITVDASEFLYALQGLSIHAILEKADTTNHLSEEQMTIEVLCWKVSGRPDLLSPEMVLDDYKVTSVYAFLLGEKEEWTQQLNLYDLLYRKHGFEARKLRITGILRDWVKRRAMTEKEYPGAGVVVREVPHWSADEQEVLLERLVKSHQEAEKLADDDLPLCTPEERWQKPDTWAAIKKGNKRAARVLDTENAADLWVKQQDDPAKFEIVERPGESVRCRYYCKVAQFCSFGKTLVATEDEAEQAS